MTEQREQQASGTAPGRPGPSAGPAPLGDDRTRPLPRPDDDPTAPQERSSGWRSTQAAPAPGTAPAGERTAPLSEGSAPAVARTVPAGEGTAPLGDPPTRPPAGRPEAGAESPRPPAPPAVPPAAAGPGETAPSGPRPAVPRSGPRPGDRAARTTATGRQRRARLRLQRIDPWSVFVLALLVSLFLAVVLVVAVVALYAVLEAAGVPDSINALVAEVTRTPGGQDPAPLLSAGRALTTAGVVAVVDVVLLTALATLAAVLYNLCASFTGGLEVTLAEHDG